MHDVMRKRLLRKLESLPAQQLYQALDYIEFLESKYARSEAPPASGLQRFAERFEDRMRARSIAPRAMTGTMRLIGTAGRVLDGLSDAGRGLLGAERPAEPRRKPRPTSPRPAEPASEEPPEGGGGEGPARPVSLE